MQILVITIPCSTCKNQFSFFFISVWKYFAVGIINVAMSNPSSARCAGAVIVIGISSIVAFIVLAIIYDSSQKNDATVEPRIAILGANYESSKLDAEILYEEAASQSYDIYSKFSRDEFFAVYDAETELPISLTYYQRIMLQCTSKLPIQWIYQGNGYSNSHVYNERKAGDYEDPETYSYASTLIFDGNGSGFKETCSGRYICKIKESTGLENLLESFVWINVHNGTNSSEKWNPEENRPESCQKWQYNFYEMEDSDLGESKVVINTTENKFMCCGGRKNVSAVFKMCGTTEECNLRRFCDEGACATAHKFRKSFISKQHGRCVQIEGTCPGTMTGEIICNVGVHTKKFMTYSKLKRTHPTNGVAVEYPSDVDPVIDPDLILELRKQNYSFETGGVGTLHCSGPRFYIAFGFIWGLEKDDGSILYVKGHDYGPFVARRDQVFGELDLSVVEKAKARKVYCITPLLNSPQEWINISMPITTAA